MPKLLLVEDHEEIWNFLSRRLRRRGFEGLVATDRREGVERARSERPDLVLLDMNVPVMDGWTAARVLKADPGMRRIPTIALTAHALAGDRDKALGAGCDDYHPKPVDFSRLVTQVEVWLRPGAETCAGAGPPPAA